MVAVQKLLNCHIFLYVFSLLLLIKIHQCDSAWESLLTVIVTRVLLLKEDIYELAIAEKWTL